MDQKVKPDPGQLAGWTIQEFLKKLGSEAPVPGGGSVAALSGSLGAALIAMYGKLGMQRKGISSDDQEILQKISIEAASYQNKLMRLITEDTLAYTEVMEAFKLPKTTDEETKARTQAIQRAFHIAVEIPFETMNACVECLQLVTEVALVGNPSAFSDLKVAEYMCHAGAMGALENININLPSIKDQEFIHKVEAKVARLKQSLDNFAKNQIKKPA